MIELFDALLDLKGLTFLGVASIPTILFWKRDRLIEIDRSFIVVMAGLTLLSVGTFINYVLQVIITLDLQFVLTSTLWEYRRIFVVVMMYLPGTVLCGIGMAGWLPALQRLDHEIKQRKMTEIELRSLAGELEHLAIKAEEANHAKSTFLASMSHELRTPLNAIIGFSEMIEGERLGPIGNENYVEYGNMIRSSGSHLLAIINDVLDISKVEAGKIDLVETEVVISQVLGDCARMMEGLIEEANIELLFDFEDDTATLLVDTRVLKQVMINLISNAIKFTEPGGSINLSSAREQGNLVIAVADSGVGMTEEETEHAVKPFAQVGDVYTRPQGGTGLGLTIVSQMMKLHGGELVLTSEPGSGTKASLIFPGNRLVQPSAGNNIIQS